MTELGTQYRQWGELSAEITHRLKKYIIPDVHVKRQEYAGKFLPRARQASVQVGDSLYIFGGDGMGEKMIRNLMEKLASGTVSCESEIPDSIAAEDIRRYCLRGGEFVRLHLRTKKFEVLPWQNS